MGSAGDHVGQQLSMESLLSRVQDYAKEHMGQYDASHNYEHIERVLGLARTIEASERASKPDSPLDSNIITLACYMHDVGDAKYLKPGEDGATMAESALLKLGANPDLARYIQVIVNHVSYTKESKDPSKVAAVLPHYPELAIVQDADRLDALGAHGIGRIYTFNTAKGATSMQVAYAHIDHKLLGRRDRMKTALGLEMAKERCARLELFQKWWLEEKAIGRDLPHGPA